MVSLVKNVIYLLVWAGVVAVSLSLTAHAAGVEANVEPLPRVFSFDAKLLAATRQRVLAGDEVLRAALSHLRDEADKALKAKGVSVMDKTLLPPSGDKHDYMSLAPYYWPDPASSNGLPYINRDGEVNPETRTISDHEGLGRTCSLAETLALAYYFTGNEAYAAKATALVRNWFLEPATRMNPNLNFAQAVRGRSAGRGIGIIDTVGMIRLVDALGLLQGSHAWPPENQQGMEAWFRAFTEWLVTSKNGRDEAAAANNHGSWYLAQTAAYSLFTGDVATARKQAEAGKARIAAQLEPDGRQPLELRRTKSYGYSLYNLDALLTLAELGRRVDVDLFTYRTADGRSLRAAVDYLKPYFPSAKAWPNKQIEPVKSPDLRLAGLLRRAAIGFHDPQYEKVLDQADPQELGSSRFQLLWPKAR